MAPDPELVEMYTRVLMGAIDLASAVVPKNTQSGFLDLNTRQPLYSKGLDYREGGHSCLIRYLGRVDFDLVLPLPYRLLRSALLSQPRPRSRGTQRCC